MSRRKATERFYAKARAKGPGRIVRLTGYYLPGVPSKFLVVAVDDGSVTLRPLSSPSDDIVLTEE